MCVKDTQPNNNIVPVCLMIVAIRATTAVATVAAPNAEVIAGAEEDHRHAIRVTTAK